ncbi:MAG: hypothetical protein JNK19_02210 [Tabrizicola sp.]|nr:hypothetical protein [Tabrizicola sp.]
MSDPFDEDLAARKHTAAHDPLFPERREEAYGRVITAIDQALVPLGYQQKGSTWSRMSEHGKSAVHLQRNRYGWEVQILLRFVTPDGQPPATWDDDEMTMERFGDAGDDPGRLAFLDVLDNPATLSRAISLLVDEAHPWLEELHFPQD